MPKANNPIFLVGIIVLVVAAVVGGWFMLGGDDARDLPQDQADQDVSVPNDLIDRSDSGKCDPACKDGEVCQRSEIQTGHFRDNFPEVLIYYNCRKIACPEGTWRGDTESACPASVCGQAETCQPVAGTYITPIGSCRNCQPFCNNPESYVSYNDCNAACGEKCEKDFDTIQFPQNCWACLKFAKDEVGQTPTGDSSKIAPAKETPIGWFEFLDTGTWQPVERVKVPGTTHVIVAGDGTPDIQTFLPIVITAEQSDKVITVTIDGPALQNCRGETGCSKDIIIGSEYSGGSLRLEARGKDNELLAEHEQ